jgi:hypothetical protein
VVRGGVLHAIDAFTLQTGLKGTEWIVGIDGAGELGVAYVDSPDAVPPPIRRALAFHEVSGGTRRVIETESLFLFEMRLLEQTPDSPGVNDPVYLYGTLLGPLPSTTSFSEPLFRIEGQLTVNRGDVLTGLVASARWAFRCAHTSGDRPARVFSMMVGGDRHEAVARGQGAVLVYPMLGVDADDYALTPGNEEIVSHVLYDLLSAWWIDVAREDPPAFRSADTLPVPSRRQHERRLAHEGFTIKGDVAVRARTGWAGALPGPFGREARQIPPEGRTEDFLGLAVEALMRAPAWPSPSGAALSRLVRSATGAEPPVLPPQLQVAGPVDFKGRAVPAWVQHFIGTHAPSGSLLTPGPDDPAVPRALSRAAANAAATVLERLSARFDGTEDV